MNKSILECLIFLICFTSPLFAESNILLRAGVEHFNWSPYAHGSLNSTAVVNSEAYQLLNYSFDFYYNNSKWLNVDYYQPMNSEIEGDFYVNDLNRACASPFSFLLDIEQPYILQLLLTAEYTRDYRVFSTSIKTISRLKYHRLDGTITELDGLSSGVLTTTKFQANDISFDILGGFFQTLKPSFLKTFQIRIGYIESDCLQPIGKHDILSESRIESRGFNYGFKTKDRGESGFNFHFYYAYSSGNVVSFNEKYGISHNHKFGDIWYNYYYTRDKIKFMFTVGYFAEWIEVLQGEAQLRIDTLRTTYFKTGVYF